VGTLVAEVAGLGPAVLALVVGALMLSYGLTLAAASEILKANVSRLDATVAITVFAQSRGI
jgi:hypothetical protein